MELQRSTIILNRYSKDVLPKKNKKGSKSRWLQLAHQGQALRVLKKKSPPYREGTEKHRLF
ncbi:hypothetical protein CHX27_06135 [Flavobacterium aurantiibacter]|uniref:Uncharacterized protein n=1 Tax=Flavobacterium aurantiibacter TaxID=2023067 RepID=A0A255ZXF3_9FLAO|nr:hypothetical protein CHX27_06135 [Flavobacterium aurantiibacter]